MKQNHKDRGYAGFISYRHVSPDQEIAEALHKMLEHNHVRPNKKVPRAIRPVFMDKKELPLLADLDEGITRALDQSECLFVICSPNLPKSKYCLREIEYFKQIHGGDTNRIFTLLVAGTPEESFPEILRTKTKYVTDPDGTVHAQQVEAEPLYADVRGKDLKDSLKKLRRTEYLRLAAGFYGCSYDSLYKRRTRWIAGVIAQVLAVTLALGAAFGGYVYARNRQYDAARANTYASYAEKQTADQNEMLALALWDYVQPATSPRLEVALRNAAMQLDYRRRSEPVAAVFQVPYDHESYTLYHESSTENQTPMEVLSTIYYLNESANQVLIFENDVCTIVDAKTGAVTLKTAVDKIFVDHRELNYYLLLETHLDEKKVMQDYVVMYDLNTNEKIREFSFRKASRADTNYKLIAAAETNEFLMVTDKGEPVAYMTKYGEQLTKEEFTLACMQYLTEGTDQEPESEVAPCRVIKKRTLLGEQSVVADDRGNMLLELGKNITLATFSSDWSYVACEADGEIRVYDIGTGQMINRWQTEQVGLGSLHMLPDSTYLLHTYWSGNSALTLATDWMTGRELIQIHGNPMISTQEHAFFTVQNGLMTRYEYTPMDLGVTGKVVAHTAQRTLAVSDGRVYLLSGEDGQPVLDVEIPSDSRIRWDGQLSCIMIPAEDGIRCYDGNGQLQWSQPLAGDMFAIGEDGSLCAWQDADGNIHIVDGSTGMEQWQISGQALSSAGTLSDLAVSSDGLCAAGTECVLWIPRQGSITFMEAYSDLTLYGDGKLILWDRDARILDFAIYDTVSNEVMYQPEDNTGAWAYHAGSGYLVRQAETSSNHTTNRIEVLRCKGKTVENVGQILLDENQAASLILDSTGQWLSIQQGDRTKVYRLEDMYLHLDAICTVYYEADAFWARELQGECQYSANLYHKEEMMAYANTTLTSSLGKRQLTEYEEELYSFTDEK